MFTAQDFGPLFKDTGSRKSDVEPVALLSFKPAALAQKRPARALWAGKAPDAPPVQDEKRSNTAAQSALTIFAQSGVARAVFSDDAPAPALPRQQQSERATVTQPPVSLARPIYEAEVLPSHLGALEPVRRSRDSVELVDATGLGCALVVDGGQDEGDVAARRARARARAREMQGAGGDACVPAAVAGVIAPEPPRRRYVEAEVIAAVADAPPVPTSVHNRSDALPSCSTTLVGAQGALRMRGLVALPSATAAPAAPEPAADSSSAYDRGHDGSGEDYDDDGGDGSSEDSDDDADAHRAPALAARPVFVPRHARATLPDEAAVAAQEEAAAAAAAAHRLARVAEAGMLVASELQREDAESAAAAAAAEAADMAGKPDDADRPEDDEAEFAAWRLRELHRVARDAEAGAAAAAERADTLRRRGLSESERAAEDAALAAAGVKVFVKERRARAFLQKYHHRGAFYVDEDTLAAEGGGDKPDVRLRPADAPVAGTDGTGLVDRTSLPQVMQVRNFGRKGRTKWTHLAAEDTSRLGHAAPGGGRLGGLNEEDSGYYRSAAAYAFGRARATATAGAATGFRAAAGGGLHHGGGLDGRERPRHSSFASS